MGVERGVVAAHLAAHLALLPSLAERWMPLKLPGCHGEMVCVRRLDPLDKVGGEGDFSPKYPCACATSKEESFYVWNSGFEWIFVIDLLFTLFRFT